MAGNNGTQWGIRCNEKGASQNPALSAILRLSKATLWVAGGKPTLLPVVAPKKRPASPVGALCLALYRAVWTYLEARGDPRGALFGVSARA